MNGAYTIPPIANGSLGYSDLNCPDTVVQIFYVVTNLIGFTLNVILLFIVIYHTANQLRPYSQVLIMACIVDIYSSAAQFLIQARPIRIGVADFITFSLDGLLPRLVANWPMFKGGNLNYILMFEYIGCYFSVCYGCVPFVFRYFMVCRGYRLPNPVLYLIVFFLFLLATLASFAINYASADVYDVNILRQPTPDPNCIRYLPQFGALTNQDHEFAYNMFLLWFQLLTYVLMTYLITLFCAIRIHLFLRKQVNASYVDRNVQKQISFTLAFYAINPLIAFYGPNTVSVVLEIIEIRTLFIFKILFAVYALVPVFNALASLLLITSYRIAFLALVYNVLEALGIRLWDSRENVSSCSQLQRYPTSKGRDVCYGSDQSPSANVIGSATLPSPRPGAGGFAGSVRKRVYVWLISRLSLPLSHVSIAGKPMNETSDLNCPNLLSQFFYTTTNFLGIFLNSILLFIVRYHTPSALKPYAQVLSIACVVDIYSSTAQYLTQARPIRLGDGDWLTFAADGLIPQLVEDWPMFAGGRLNYAFIPEYIGCYFSICFGCVPFIFRYFMVVWSRRMPNYLLCIVIFVFFLLATVLSVLVNIAAAFSFDSNIKKMPIPDPNCTRYLPQFGFMSNINDGIAATIFVVWYRLLNAMLASYFITAFCAIRIHFFLRKQVAHAYVDKKAINPLVAYYGPSFATTILESAGIRTAIMFNFIYAVYALVPVMNAVVSFVFIPTYGRALYIFLLNSLDFMGLHIPCLKHPNEVTHVSNTQTTSSLNL